jgi:hypothetical protein
MKKIVSILTISAALAVTASAQGLVNFNNSSAAATKISTNAVVGGAAQGLSVLNTGTSSFYFALFASTTTNLVGGSSAAIVGNTGSSYVFNASGWTFQGYATNGTTRAGQVQGNSALALTGIAGGATANFVVVGWSASIGSTISALQTWYNSGSPATAGLLGQSAVTGLLTAGDGAGVSTPSPFGAASPFAPGFVLGQVAAVSAVPEPGTMALAAIGGASLLLFRRKK